MLQSTRSEFEFDFNVDATLKISGNDERLKNPRPNFLGWASDKRLILVRMSGYNRVMENRKADESARLDWRILIDRLVIDFLQE